MIGSGRVLEAERFGAAAGVQSDGFHECSSWGERMERLRRGQPPVVRLARVTSWPTTGPSPPWRRADDGSTGPCRYCGAEEWHGRDCGRELIRMDKCVRRFLMAATTHRNVPQPGSRSLSKRSMRSPPNSASPIAALGASDPKPPVIRDLALLQTSSGAAPMGW
jgi:hypothetical protein